MQATEQILQFVAVVVYTVYDFPFLLTPDWVRHCSGQRDHGHPGSGRQLGGHEKQTGAHGGGDQPLWTACHRRGPGVCYCVVFSFRECGNFKPDNLTVGLSSLHLRISTMKVLTQLQCFPFSLDKSSDFFLSLPCRKNCEGYLFYLSNRPSFLAGKPVAFCRLFFFPIFPIFPTLRQKGIFFFVYLTIFISLLLKTRLLVI